MISNSFSCNRTNRRKRDKSARGLREEQRGDGERERERDYEVVYSLKVVHNFTVG